MATTEDKYVALSGFWTRYNSEFSTWYLGLSFDEQRAMVTKASPDMPERSASARHSAGLAISPSDLLVPEINLEALLAAKGKILILFLSRRLSSSDLCFQSDVLLLNDQFNRGIMPLFSNQANISLLDTPFVDPMDLEENIRSMSHDASEETRQQIQGYLATGQLVHLDVWICLKIRRAAIVTFIEVLVLEFQRTSISALFVPTYEELLAAEITQVEFFHQQQQFQLQQLQIDSAGKLPSITPSQSAAAVGHQLDTSNGVQSIIAQSTKASAINTAIAAASRSTESNEKIEEIA